MGKERGRSVIRSAAYFVVCQNCREHGHIVLADGRKSDEVYSITTALVEMGNLITAGAVESDEVSELRRQIETSGLELEIGLKDVLVAANNAAHELEELVTSLPLPSPRRRPPPCNN